MSLDETQGTVSAEELYKDLAGSGEKARILQLREVLAEAIDVLNRALQSGISEIERESLVPLIQGCLRSASRLAGHDPGLEDTVTAMEVAIASRRTQGYQRVHLISLREVMRMLSDSPFISEKMLNQALGILERAGFDLGCPLKDVPLDEF